MNYIFLIYADEAAVPKAPTDRGELKKWLAPWDDYTDALKEAGILLGSNPLEPSGNATTVSCASRGQKPVFTDGPFAETKEQLTGYYLVDCKNLDEALGWAAKCPGVNIGRVEVRPIANFK